MDNIDNNVETNVGGKKSSIFKIITIVVVLALVAFGVWFFMGNNVAASVATVNGEEISKSEFNDRLENVKNNFAAQGGDVSNPEAVAAVEKEVLQSLINETLLLQAAEEAGIVVTSEEVDAQMAVIKQGFESEEAYQEALVTAGVKESRVKDELTNQIIIEKYLATKLEGETPEVTEQEIAAFYEQIKGQEGIPPLSEISEQIKAQIIQQKNSAGVQTILTELTAQAEIEISEQYQ